MGRNSEIKARVADMDALEQRVAAMADHGPEVIIQHDTFFNCPRGRLKLRAFADGSGELIAYTRPDSAGPKTSTYDITQVADAAGMTSALERSLGVLGRLHKERRLYLKGDTRIHLDRVEALGQFMELEVVLKPHQQAHDGERIATELMSLLGIPAAELVSGSYLDLLTQRSR